MDYVEHAPVQYEAKVLETKQRALRLLVLEDRLMLGPQHLVDRQSFPPIDEKLGNGTAGSGQR